MATNFVEIPVFTGHDLHGWIDWLVEFFDREQFTNDDKMNFAQSFMEGEARVWLLQKRKMMIFESWEELKQSLLIRFGSYKDPEIINVVLEQKRRWGKLLEFWKIPEATETITKSKPQVPYSSLNLEPEVDSLGHRRNLSRGDFNSGVGFDVSFEPDNNNLSSAELIHEEDSSAEHDLSLTAESLGIFETDMVIAVPKQVVSDVLVHKGDLESELWHTVDSLTIKSYSLSEGQLSNGSISYCEDIPAAELAQNNDSLTVVEVDEHVEIYQSLTNVMKSHCVLHSLDILSSKKAYIRHKKKQNKCSKTWKFKYKPQKLQLRPYPEQLKVMKQRNMAYTSTCYITQVGLMREWVPFKHGCLLKHFPNATITVLMRRIHENLKHDSKSLKLLLVGDVTFTVKHSWRSKQLQTVSGLNTKHSDEIEVVSKSGKLHAVAVLGLVSCRCVKGINLRYSMLQLTQSEIIALQGGVAVVYEQLLVSLVIQSVSEMLMAWDNVVVIRNTIHLHCFAKLWPATVKFTSCLAWKQLVHYRYIGLTSINPVEQGQCIQGKTRGKPRNMSFTTGWYVTNVDGAHIFVLVKVFFPPHMHKLRNGIMVAAGMSKRQIIQLYQEKRMLLSTGLTFLLWYEFNDDSTMNVEFDILFKGDLLLSQVQNSDTRAQWIGMKNTAYSKGDITLSVGFIIIPKLQKEQLTATFSGFITVFPAAYKSNQSIEAQLHCIFWVLQLVKVLEADHDVHLLPPAASVTKDNIDALKKIVAICYGKASSKLADKLCFCGGGNDMTVVLKSLKKTTRKRRSQHSFTKADMTGEGKDSDHIGGFVVVVIFFKYDQYPLLGFYAYFGKELDCRTGVLQWRLGDRLAQIDWS